MKSMPGSARVMPLHGQVKFVPSMRNWFSFVPEPNAERVAVMVLLAGEVGDTPGAALMDRTCWIVASASLEVLRTEASARTRASSFDARARCLDDD